jgi:mRNA interferase RelE/StbE
MAAIRFLYLVYQLEITKPAIRALRRIPANAARLIRAKLDQLAEDPMPAPNVKPLKGRPGCRLRVGDWRVVYELDHPRRRLIVLDIGPRGSVYDR